MKLEAVLKPYSIAILVLGLCACQPATSDTQVATAQAAVPATASSSAVSQDGGPFDVLAFAQAACAGCHAVEPTWLSPNADAPTFEDIANREGLTAETLSTWLRDAHNYPEVMDFDLTGSHVEELTAYILRLRSKDYQPPE